MLIDLLDPANNLSVNIELIKVLGLESAAYCSILTTINRKAYRKGKLIEEEYFKLDRKYIKEILGYDKKAQLDIEKVLYRLEIIVKNKSDEDLIKIDTEKLASYLSADEETLERLKKIAKVETTVNKKVSKIDGIKEKMRSYFEECSNEELKEAFNNWVDSVVEKRGAQTKVVCNMFKEDIINYSKGDLDVALAVIKVATIQGWADASWSINSYEKSKATSKRKAHNLEVKPVTKPINSAESQINFDEVF